MTPPIPRWLGAALASAALVAAAARSQREARRSAQLADEQAALRRVATLVARRVPPPEVFAAVAREVGLLLGVDATYMARYEPDDTATGVAAWSSAGDDIPVGTPVDLEDDAVAGSVFRTGRPARMHGYEHASGPAAEVGRKLGVRASVGAPIVVDDRLWGVMIASSKGDGSLPAETEGRIAAFTELVATAISDTEARAQVGRLADEQAALWRVATLVARGAPPEELFAAVVEEVGRVFAIETVAMGRYENDGTMTNVAISDRLRDRFPVGGRWPLGGKNVSTLVAQTGRPARIDSYAEGSDTLTAAIRERDVQSSIGTPIVVEGTLWGVMTAGSTPVQPLPAGIETRLGNFTELVAAAMSNIQARTSVQHLAEEQSALRRVATLVARESPPGEVFAAVAEEVSRLLRSDDTGVLRYEDGDTVVVLANSNAPDPSPTGSRRPLQAESVAGRVRRTGRPARIDDYTQFDGALAADAQETGIRAGAGAPILVKGRLWGVIVTGSREARLPAGTEEHIAQFTDLVATAISNVEARRELAASRARLLAATDDERRRVVRDLHDGAQQRLVHTIITLKLASRALQKKDENAPALMAEALGEAERANVELRELARGILPAVLTQGGLHAGVDSLASRMPVPVQIDVPVGRLPPAVEATAYFVVAEALTNIAKHAHAGHAEVRARIDDGTLALQVGDDGVGGARPDGSGLTGLADRLAARDGKLRVESPPDGGTLVAAAIPLSG